jgi:hypothetical protein
VVLCVVIILVPSVALVVTAVLRHATAMGSGVVVPAVPGSAAVVVLVPGLRMAGIFISMP